MQELAPAKARWSIKTKVGVCHPQDRRFCRVSCLLHFPRPEFGSWLAGQVSQSVEPPAGGGTFIKFWHEPLTPENIWSVAIRLLYAVAITAPAWYTARESARHRTNSDRARQTELELASIGPFIELMPEEKKVQIREQLTTHYFGRTVDAHTANHPLDASSLKEFVVELVKAMKK